MRINEDYIDALDNNDDILSSQPEVTEEQKPFPYVICFGFDKKKLNSDNYKDATKNDTKRLATMISSFPFVHKVSELDNKQEDVRGYDVTINIDNAGLELYTKTVFYGRYFVIFGIDAELKKNIKNATTFITWLYKLPRSHVNYIIFINPANTNKDKESFLPGELEHLFDFIDYRSEKFNSEERNPVRVSFNGFLNVISYASETTLEDVIPYVFNKMDLMDVYVRANNITRNESREHDELRHIVNSADALKKYTADLSRLLTDKTRSKWQSNYDFEKYNNIPPDYWKEHAVIEFRGMDYENFLDENLWSKYYKVTYLEDTPHLNPVNMVLSSIGVKKDTNLRRSYIEMAIIEEIKGKNIVLMVVLTRSPKILAHIIKTIIPEVPQEELSAIRKETTKLMK